MAHPQQLVAGHVATVIVVLVAGVLIVVGIDVSSGEIRLVSYLFYLASHPFVYLFLILRHVSFWILDCGFNLHISRSSCTYFI